MKQFMHAFAMVALVLFSTPVQARIDRFAAVDPGQIYRGSAPWAEEDLQALQKLGIRTIIDLRDADEGADVEHVMATKMGFTHLNLKLEWDTREISYTPTPEDIALAREASANPPPGFEKVVTTILSHLDHPTEGEPKFTTDFPTEASIGRIMEAVERTAARPIFIHCVMGRDRTGLVTALHRVNSGWTREEAYAEMQAFDFKPMIIMEGLRRYLFEFK